MSATIVAAILLAAGESRRMGQPKALLPWLGTTLIAYQVEQLIEAGAFPVVVVLGAEAKRVAVPLRHFSQVVLVANPLYQAGKTASIRAGLRALPPKTGALVLQAVDQPRRGETMRRLIAAHLADDALITVPLCQGRRGHPPVLSATLLPTLNALSEQQEGLREVMRRYAAETLEVPMETSEVLLDLNTPDDYRQALAYFQGL